MKYLFAEINQQRFIQYIIGFSKHLEKSFRKSVEWPMLTLHLAAILITIPLVVLNFDWHYFVFFRSHEFLQYVLFLSVPLGGLVPLLLPPVFYLIGKREEITELQKFSYALTQAGVIGLFWSSIYKAFTGRAGPDFDTFDFSMDNYSRDWAFGLLRRGVFDGWPSGHTTIAFAFAYVFSTYQFNINLEELPDQYTVLKLFQYRKFAYLFAIFVGFGVSTNIHWFSDFVAGSLIGISIGTAVISVFADTNEVPYEDLAFGDLKPYWWIYLSLVLVIIFSIVGLDDLPF